MALDTRHVLMALAYALLFVASIPSLAAFEGFEWAVAPIWLALVGYSASVLKNLSDGDTSERFERVVWLSWMTYYTLCVVWPFPLHWYDSLPMVALFLEKSTLRDAMLTLYYAFSASTYMGHGDAMQVSGRLLLVALLASYALNGHNDLKQE